MMQNHLKQLNRPIQTGDKAGNFLQVQLRRAPHEDVLLGVSQKKLVLQLS